MSRSPTVTMFPLIFHLPDGSGQLIIVPHALDSPRQLAIHQRLYNFSDSSSCSLWFLPNLLVFCGSWYTSSSQAFTHIPHGSFTPQVLNGFKRPLSSWKICFTLTGSCPPQGFNTVPTVNCPNPSWAWLPVLPTVHSPFPYDFLHFFKWPRGQ